MKRKKCVITLLLLAIMLLTGCSEKEEQSKSRPTISRYETSQRKTETYFSYVGTSALNSEVSTSTSIPVSETSIENDISSASDVSLNENLTLGESASHSNEISTVNAPETIDVSTKKITISFLGNCTLASIDGEEAPGNMINYLNTMDTSYFFEKAMPFIGNDDFTIANCESVFSDTSTVKFSEDPTTFCFKSNPKNAFVFSDNSIDAVSLANNHSYDYGPTGFEETKKALDTANVKWGDNLANVIYLEKYDIKIGIICAKFYGADYANFIIEKIKNVSRNTDIQILFFNGGQEDVSLPEDWKIEGCHKFIDSGADLVIGTGPHILQSYEEYKGISIMYSVGNFCYGGDTQPKTKTVIYQQTFSFDANNNLLYSNENIIPFYVYVGDTNNWQPTPVENIDEKNEILKFLYK